MRPALSVAALLLGLGLFSAPTFAPSAEEDAAVRKAIEKGVAVLKDMKTDKGRQHHQTGTTALIGLTLLECGIPATDAAVQKAATIIRQGSPDLTHTYSLALAIMFLDRLGDAGDVPIVHALALRLLAGQNTSGGWGYNTPRPGDEDVRRLTYLVKERGEAPKPVALDPSKPKPLPREMQEQIDAINKAQPKGRNDGDAFQNLGDNSNTQFAILGLWVARRHGIPIDKALAAVEKRFRSSQGSDGGWGYIPTPRGQGGMGATASMTCAGLLALAMSHGAANEAALHTDPKAKSPREPAEDQAVRNGLMALGTAVGSPTKRGLKGAPAGGPVMHRGFYFLWSLERVAVAYSLNTIGTKDWYAWGSEMLLASQTADGSWKGEHGPEVDTCFALLFLRRVNLAKDLTASLKGMQDPGETVLKAGGIGGEGLLAKGLKSGIVLGDKGTDNAGDATNLESEAARMGYELVQATPEQQAKLLDKLKDSKGTIYTEALAGAIPQLNGAVKARARDALAERLARMTAATLRSKMKEESLELRRAAAIACYMKEDKSLVPDLIGLLDDTEMAVAKAAHAALKELTSQDFGPVANPTTAERAKAIADWKTWWKKQGPK